MTNWLTSLPVALALALPLGLGGPVLAQQGAGSAADTLPLAEPSGDQPGQPFEKAVFTDWRIVCALSPDQVETCNMQQLARDGQGNPVSQISIVPLPVEAAPRAAAVEVVTPLETLLSGDVRIQVDDDAEQVYRFTFCNGEACFARFAFTQAEVAQFKAGGAASIRIVPLVAPDQVATVTISLKGFTAAFDSLAPSQ